MGKIIGNGCSRDCGTVRIYMKNQRKVFQSLTLILQFGLNMIVPIVMCTLLGAWLGKKYGMPIITVPLFIMGALAGFNNIFKMAKKIYGQEMRGSGIMLRRLNDALPGLVLGIIVYGAAVFLAGIWFVPDKLRFTTGLAIGIALACGMAVNMAVVLRDAVEIYGEAKARSKIIARSITRYLVVVIVFS